MADSLQAMALEEARRALEEQQRALEGLRTRSTAVVSVASLTLGLSTASGVGEHKAVSIVVLVAMTFLFGWVVVLAADLLRPRVFTFTNDVRSLISKIDELGDAAASAPAVHEAQRHWAYWMQEHADTNKTQLDSMIDDLAKSCCVLAAIVILGVLRIGLLAVL